MTSTPTSTPTPPPLLSCESFCRWFGLRGWIGVFVIALVARAAWGLLHHGSQLGDTLQFPDEHQYWDMARAFHAGKGLPDELGFQATRMPLYPSWLSLFTISTKGVLLVKIVQWVIGAVGAVFTVGLGSTLINRRVGLMAGLLVAVDPFLIFFSSLLLTETIYITALVGFCWYIVHHSRSELPKLRYWLLAGLLASLCVYIRESSLGLVVILLAFGVFLNRFQPKAIIGATLALLVIAATLLPWALRNQRVVGEPVFLTTRAGISLYDGVRPAATGESDLGSVKQMPAVQGLSEVEWNRFFLQASYDEIRHDPLRVLKLVPVKWLRTWNPIPNAGEYQSWWVRLIAAGWCLPTFALAVVSVVRWRSLRMVGGGGVLIFLMIPAMYVSALHSLFVGSVRYRLGVLPMVAILASISLVAFFEKMCKPSTHGDQRDLV